MHNLSAIGTAAILAFINCVGASPTHQARNTYSLYPNIADTSHATPALVDFLHGFFTTKSLHNIDGWASYFAPSGDVYFDAIIGFGVDKANIPSAFSQFLSQGKPDGRSYPLTIIGDMNSAVVFGEDTPDMFGYETRTIAAVDFKDGKVARWVDYWDGRHDGLIALKSPSDKFPKTFGESNITTTPNPVIRNITSQLNDALSTGNSIAAASLFSFDAVFEDRTTRTRIEGRKSIQQYFSRALTSAPYGNGTTVRHIVGSSAGGAYEWIGSPTAPTQNGISGFKLDSNGSITILSTVWDSSQVNNSTMEMLVQLAIQL
ncbi:uncharacterized protein TrAFT101_000042 [Trichoderma asperellum]|uniref:SnoaL-like domain-containing protein n=1 Tax=Trichoderma asperellum (strain ATCC 204424 / CBS 433.97 / NBRC 101777) TaxID=1042311 RepID=A0A2T3YR70_TRIA4|nr:hypothetical protein M441DRAFT_154429 [Trichoderma asperellum CBS 433.97]KAH8129679.1 hypothetical protein LI328DRAFT_162937 [Trichoderma asperelloides]PTB35014.1 hypothetical protein M441DRAFT_154429 [Trichoderma asperellum CBS 433.97]UKZ84119.1 hypothetical protein TrAFT101_000042 [Trichoderma asperellum]